MERRETHKHINREFLNGYLIPRESDHVNPLHFKVVTEKEKEKGKQRAREREQKENDLRRTRSAPVPGRTEVN